ncbi:hypothetical protein VZT92_003947 [Zoarces viviparus]|uniref:Uncharacterized protein n=1 Tax=Zoarces viviparus TaxID=48416 RepID=A0AAW1FVY3_ZOAVI
MPGGVEGGRGGVAFLKSNLCIQPPSALLQGPPDGAPSRTICVSCVPEPCLTEKFSVCKDPGFLQKREFDRPEAECISSHISCNFIIPPKP